MDAAINHILLNQDQEMVQLMHNFLSGEICILQDTEYFIWFLGYKCQASFFITLAEFI